MDENSKLQEFTVLALVPAIVGSLILASWGMSVWQVGPPFLNAGIALFATFFGGWQRFLGGCQDLFHRKITVNVFVLVALTATIAVGEFRPAAVIIFIMVVVGALESYTMDKNRRSIRNLLNLTPRTATVRRGEGEAVVPLDAIVTGTVLIIKPGERVPVDAIVMDGYTSVDQAAITGESMPVEKGKGSALFGGTLNLTGHVEARATKVGQDTMLARIVHLVEEAQSTKAPIQNLADRFTVWFLPVVLLLAVLVYAGSGNIETAVSILLVACPCAFAIATPTAVTAGISNMARRGVLVKGGAFFELAGELDALVMDKTGTFTIGRPKVLEVIPFKGMGRNDILEMAAVAETYSEHPLAKAVVNCARETGLSIPEPDEFKVEIGRGVTVQWKGRKIVVGQLDFLREMGIPVSPETDALILSQTQQGRTAVLVAQGGQTVGLIAIADEIRAEAKAAIDSLHQLLGNTNITMLTGDNPLVAGAVAKAIGVKHFQASLLPGQKQEFVRQLQASGHKVGMIGDGINDAPALASADVGIAMGGTGTDVAIDTADVTLMNDDLFRVVDFILMSRAVLRRIKLNIFLSIIYNVIGLTLGAFGMLTPIMAIIFQEAGCISVVLGSMLLLWAKPQRPWVAGRSETAGPDRMLISPVVPCS